MYKQYITRCVIWLLVVVSSIGGVTGQITISGPSKVQSGGTGCYTPGGTSCSPQGYCWTANGGIISTYGCGVIIVDALKAKAQPNLQTPPGGGGGGTGGGGGGGGGACGALTGITVTFPTVNVETAGYVTLQDNCGRYNTFTFHIEPPVNAGGISPWTQTVTCSSNITTLQVSNNSGGDGTYTYQWQSSLDNVNWTTITGAVGASYLPSNLALGTNWFRSIISSFGFSAATSAVMVINNPQPFVAGTISNPSQNINAGATPAAIICSSASGGSCGPVPYHYLWQQSSDNVNFVSTGDTNQNHSTGALLTSTYYRRYDSYNSFSAYTNTAKVTVNLQSGAITPVTQTVKYTDNPAALSISAGIGGTGSYTYQWLSSSTVNGTYTPVGAGSSYSPGPLNYTTWFEVITRSDGMIVNSSPVVVNVPMFAGTVSGPSSSIVYKKVAFLLNVLPAAGGNGGGTFNYQWMQSTDGVIFNPIHGATGIAYTSGQLTAPRNYYFRQVSSGGQTLSSDTVLVQVSPQLLPGNIVPASMVIATGTSPGMLTADAASGGGCNGSYTYNWQQSTDGINFTNIGIATQNYTPGNSSVNMQYRRQVLCGADSAYSNTSVISIGTAGSVSNMNYIRVRDIDRPGITDTVTSNLLTDPNDVKQNTQYFDGLGRLIQTVSRQSSPLQKDIVTPVVYDPFNRESIKYMPYVSATNDGNFKTIALQEMGTFNAIQFPDEQFYYGQTSYEASPLNRTVATYAPGNSWVGSNRGVTNQYLYNTPSDSVRLWTVAALRGSIPATNAIYAPGQLYKIITADEQGHQVVEYKDKSGHVILKKVQLSDIPGPAHVGWLNTYYVYDDLGRLRFVLQPRAVELINGTWGITASIANELCFRYEYDGRNRMVIKKIPGAGETWMVYDARDRLVMSQDSSLRSQGKWMVTEYDALNRSDSTGLMTDNHTNSYHQALASTSIYYPVVASYPYMLLTLSYYDDYKWVTALNSPILTATLNTANATNSTYFVTSYNSSPQYARPVAAATSTRGLATGSSARVINSNGQFLPIVQFYDDRGRIIQTQKVNYTNALDLTTLQYDFSGKPLRSLLVHKKNGIPSQQLHIVLTKTNYDPMGRLKSIYKNLDGASRDQLIDSMQYDELGQLRTKYLGNSLDSLVYDYNIRGWLTGINKKYVSGSASNYFGMELAYDKNASVAGTTSYTSSIFNGNIAGTIWKSAGDGVGRKYDFSYDNVNRLTGAAFLQNTSGSNWDNAKIDFTVSRLSYDANGNILSMNQNGFKIGGSGPVDQLVYSYIPNSNKLLQVIDGANDANSKLGDFHYNPTTKGPTDFVYEGNGNLVSDNNKGIDKITYNFLNLPQLVHINGKGNITYTYDAAGNKLTKVTADSLSNHATTTLYAAGFVYQQTDTITNPTGGIDTLQFMAHEEGRARLAFHKYLNGSTNYSWEYDFYEKDHLGNTRVLLSQEKDSALYTATMEGRYRSTENLLFYNIPATVYARNLISGYPVDTTYGNPNDSVARLNPTGGQKIGPSIILKVMSGDKVDIGAQYYYNNITNTNSPSITANDILGSLATGIVSLTGGAHGTLADLGSTTGPLAPALNSFLTNKATPLAGKPTAYLNWILLDNQFNYVSSFPQSGALPVGASGVQGNGKLQPQLAQTGIPITKSGYLYIYVSNATPGWDVFFDNLSVKTYSGPLVEENHYYPFGLTMAGISDKALKGNYTENKYRWNKGSELQNKEFSDGSGLEMYETHLRELDPQLGRWWQIDPVFTNGVDGDDEKNGQIIEGLKSQSPYASMDNNPIRLDDPNGDCAPCIPLIAEGIELVETLFGITATATVASSPKFSGPIGNSSFITSSYVEMFEQNAAPAPTITLTTADQRSLNKLNESLGLSQSNVVKTEAKKTPAEERADRLSQKQRPGQDFTKAGAGAVRDVNKEKTGNKCANCGVQTQPGKKHVKGVTPPDNESHVDHKDPKSKGGSGTPDNGEELCRKCNIKKSNN